MDCSLKTLGALEAPIVQRIMDTKGSLREETIVGSVQEWVDKMSTLLAGIEIGKTYVYFDGTVIPTDAANVRIRGLKRKHDLARPMQVAALTDPAVENALGDVEYWRAKDPAR